MKVYYLGRRIDGKYERRNWIKRTWSLFLYRLQRTLRVAGVLMLIAWFGIGCLKFGIAYAHGTEISYVAPVAFAETVPTDGVTKAQDIVINEIAACETQGVAEPDSAIILDTNGQMSIGAWMYQITTVQRYEKEMTGKDINRVAAINIATNHQEAMELTRYIIFTDHACNNWYNCANKLDTASKVKLIEAISQ
jgi:hypothetical protein